MRINVKIETKKKMEREQQFKLNAFDPEWQKFVNNFVSNYCSKKSKI